MISEYVLTFSFGFMQIKAAEKPIEKDSKIKADAVAKTHFEKPFIYDITNLPPKSAVGQSYGALAIAMAAIDSQKLVKRFLGVPKPVQNIILESLSINDLSALELAVGTKSELTNIVKDLQHVRVRKIFNEMLEMFPKPAPISFNSWPELKDEEKIWLFCLFQLQEFGVDFSKSPINNINFKNKRNAVKEIIAKRMEIQAFLDSIVLLDIHQFPFVEKRKFPDVIWVLRNLKELNLFGSKRDPLDFEPPLLNYRGLDYPDSDLTEEESAREKIFKSDDEIAEAEALFEERVKDYHFFQFKMKQYPKVKFY